MTRPMNPTRPVPAAAAAMLTSLLSCLLLAACTAMATPPAPSTASSAAPSAAPSPATSPALDRTAWTLSALPGAPVPAGPTATLRFEGGRMAGSDGCNRWGAPYAAAEGKLQVTGPMVGTQMACPEPAASLASAFQAALSKARGYRLAGPDGARTLELTDGTGATVARFAAQATALAGTAWQADGYNNGRQAVVSIEAGTTLTLQFGNDGRVNGHGGCNAFTGAYRIDGDRLTIGPLASTRKACMQPPATMAQEAAYLKALESSARFRREADRLDLYTADGARAASLSLKR